MSAPRAVTLVATLLGVGALALAVPGCPRRSSPDDASDDALNVIRNDVAPDAARPDRDNDGVCDDSEAYFRTDPDSPDTDHDGLSDFFELAIYSSPLSATDPPATDRVSIHERPGERAALAYDFSYRGEGEAVLGLVLDAVASVDRRQESQLGGTIAAVGADPRANVADITDNVFLGVGGIVRLRWEMRFAYPALPPMACRRAYMAYAGAYAQDRGIIYGRRVVLDVLPADPAGDDAGTATDAAPLQDASTDLGARGGGGGPVDGGADQDADPPFVVPTPWPYVVSGFCVPPPGQCQ